MIQLPSFRETKAIYPGKCKFCGQQIEKNEPILYYANEKRIAHNISQKCKDYKETVAKTTAFSQMIVQQEVQRRQERFTTAIKPQFGIPTPVLSDGYYTVVFNFNGESRHKTFRVFTGKPGKFGEGKQMISVFLGTENTNDRSYQPFAFLNGKKLSVWKRFGLYQNEIAAANYLLDGENAEAAGILYSVESGKCRRCGRLLTNPVSINGGIGPECAKKSF